MFNENSWITIRRDCRVETVQIKMLDELVGVSYGDNNVVDSDVEIVSKDGFTKLISVSKKKSDDKDVCLRLDTDYGIPLVGTKDFGIPVDRKGKYEEVVYSNIQRGDKVFINKHKPVIEQFEPRMVSVPAELARNAYFDDITPIRRFIYSEYGYTLEEALSYCQLKELNTVEEYNVLEKVFPIPHYVEEELYIVFKDSSKIPFRIDNILEFAMEGGYYLTHRYQMKNSKYPKAVLDVYFNSRIPNEVMYGSPLVKSAFFNGCSRDFPKHIPYLWATDDEMLFRDFITLVRSCGYKSAYEEKINQKDAEGNITSAWVFKFWDNRETMRWRSTSAKVTAEINRINSRPKSERIRTTVNNISPVYNKSDLYNFKTADGFCVVNGYIVKASSK